MDTNMSNYHSLPLFVQQDEPVPMNAYVSVMSYDGTYEYHDARECTGQSPMHGVDDNSNDGLTEMPDVDDGSNDYDDGSHGCDNESNRSDIHSNSSDLRIDTAAAQHDVDMRLEVDADEEMAVQAEDDEEDVSHFSSSSPIFEAASALSSLSSAGTSTASSATTGLHALAMAADIDPYPANFAGNKKDSLASPENQFITQQRLRLRDWADIIADLREHAEAAGKYGTRFTEASVYGRFKRNGSRIAVALGYEPFSERAYMHLYNTEDGGRARPLATVPSSGVASPTTAGHTPMTSPTAAQHHRQGTTNTQSGAAHAADVSLAGIGSHFSRDDQRSTTALHPDVLYQTPRFEHSVIAGQKYVMRSDAFASAVARIISESMNCYVPTEAVQSCIQRLLM